VALAVAVAEITVGLIPEVLLYLDKDTLAVLDIQMAVGVVAAALAVWVAQAAAAALAQAAPEALVNTLHYLVQMLPTPEEVVVAAVLVELQVTVAAQEAAEQVVPEQLALQILEGAAAVALLIMVLAAMAVPASLSCVTHLIILQQLPQLVCQM